MHPASLSHMATRPILREIPRGASFAVLLSHNSLRTWKNFGEQNPNPCQGKQRMSRRWRFGL
ncbi:hypothetical protein BRCON_1360 [Candidatus Sumerlaea chitinivorans]|uniref:Uncharacterized protein n=1 Tax=Sumerlaea chitinivorans TaxID=2250252 RepID=A0A2Z4Y4K6_SUMC1|nr:hypothetical protein BRCON_1360 [Candidatus Sumerlaea chitinivorans]